jgi:ubiquinone/menaquinone biosynthesis C-methylase UbiE
MSYGEYILSTGTGRVGEFELVLGRFLYERDFVGKAPILDLAPGRCWFARQNLGDIHAVDLAPEIVEHYAAEGVQITEGSAYDIPHSPDTFEAVFCCWLFEHLDDPARAMCEIRRVLKPGGMCYLVVPSDRQLTRGFWDDYTHVRPFTKTSLVQLATFNGFAGAAAEHLAFTRLAPRVVARFGPEGAYRYLRFSDVALRRLGIVNKENLVLRCHK